MPELINPDEFIISRKRKKYKFALFNNSPLCFEIADWPRDTVVDVVEIGAGNAHFLVDLAAKHPEQQFVALDVKGDRLQSGARKAEELGLQNLRFIRARADQVQELFTAHSVAAVWLTFSDPFPRKRSSGRRMTHPNFLRKYTEIIKPSGSLLIKHDSPDFFCWTLEQLVAEQWIITELSFDLHDSSLSEDYKILTAYETRWLDEDRTTHFANASKLMK